MAPEQAISTTSDAAPPVTGIHRTRVCQWLFYGGKRAWRQSDGYDSEGASTGESFMHCHVRPSEAHNEPWLKLGLRTVLEEFGATGIEIHPMPKGYDVSVPRAVFDAHLAPLMQEREPSNELVKQTVRSTGPGASSHQRYKKVTGRQALQHLLFDPAQEWMLNDAGSHYYRAVAITKHEALVIGTPRIMSRKLLKDLGARNAEVHTIDVDGCHLCLHLRVPVDEFKAHVEPKIGALDSHVVAGEFSKRAR